MTPPRNLGPALAVIGGVAVVGAAIAGLIVVGGPGDARADRLDQLTMQRIAAAGSAAQCAYVRTGAAPKSTAELEAAVEAMTTPLPEGCRWIDANAAHGITAVDYSAQDDNHIRVCATFQRPSPKDSLLNYGWDSQFSELRANRKEAGRHCFDLTLFKPSAAPDHAAAPIPDMPH